MISARRLFSGIALGTVLALAAAGCHKKPPAAAPAPPPPPPAAPVTPPPPPPPPAPGHSPLLLPGLSARKRCFRRSRSISSTPSTCSHDVFFELDKSEIRDDAKPVLQKDADWLKRWKSVQVTVEGHCDSRGSAEYNLGLGIAPRQRNQGLPGQPRRARRRRSPWSARARNHRSAPRRLSPAGSRTVAGTSSSRRSSQTAGESRESRSVEPSSPDSAAAGDRAGGATPLRRCGTSPLSFHSQAARESRGRRRPRAAHRSRCRCPRA